MLKLVVPGQGIKPTLILPLTTAMPSIHATFQQLWKKTCQKTQNIQKLFPSNFFLKKQTVESQKKFRKWSNFAIFFSFLGLLSAQPVCLFCFSSLSPIMQFLNQTSTCLDLRHAKKAELEISNSHSPLFLLQTKISFFATIFEATWFNAEKKFSI